MFKHSRRTLTILVSALAVGLVWGSLILSGGALADHKPKHNPGGNDGGEPAPPPDPAIAFSAHGHLFVMNADGSNVTRVVGVADADDMVRRAPSWSPKGTAIAFENTAADKLLGKGIYTVNLSDGAITPEVLNSETHIATHPAWSPLGDPIAYLWYEPLISETAFGEIRAVWADGTDELLFSFAPPFFVLGGLSWSPEGTRLSVVVLEKELNERHHFVAVVDLVAGTIEDVTPESTFSHVGSANWARTGDAIAFAGSLMGDAFEKALWIVDLTEPLDSPNRLVKVLPGPKNGWINTPSWSPDDSQLVFGRVDIPPRTGVWTIDLQTGDETFLLRTSVARPDWRRF